MGKAPGNRTSGKRISPFRGTATLTGCKLLTWLLTDGQGDPLLRLLGDDESYGKIYAVSRRPLLADYKRVTSIQLDLSDEKAIADQLKSAGVRDVTHVFHMAFSVGWIPFSVS